MSEPASVVELDHATLATNGMIVRGLQVALSNTQGDLKSVPKRLSVVLETRAWRGWKNVQGKTFSPKDFCKFVEAPLPDGCEFPLKRLKAIVIESHDESLIRALEEATVGERGGNRNPDGLGGKSHKTRDQIVNHDIVMIGNSTSQPEPSPDKPRSVVSQGNDSCYALRRIRRAIEEKGRSDLEPLYRRLVAGEITAHAAMIEAGFTLQSITLLKSPQYVVRGLLKHFGPADLATIVQGLTEHLATEES